ncbi:MAG: viologen exporter family transport system permease protein [Acidimicrobiaceae bacterium]|jgi:ABC-2 type transport system permease protein
MTVTTRTAAQRVLAERGGLVVAVGFYIAVVAVLAGLWRVAADANGGSVAGYSAIALTWYIVTSEACTVALNIRMIDDIGRDISSGAVAVELLRPASVLGVRVSAEIGRALPRLAAIATTGAVLATITAGGPPQPSALVLAVPSLVLAIACNIVTQHAFAASAFWFRDAGSAWFLYQKLVFVLGGMLIPLELLPNWLHTTASVLPFQAMSYIPARLASGHFEPALLLEQVGWLAVLWLAASAAFRSGERRLQVVGG